jgi:hypothetical protein
LQGTVFGRRQSFRSITFLVEDNDFLLKRGQKDASGVSVGFLIPNSSAHRGVVRQSVKCSTLAQNFPHRIWPGKQNSSLSSGQFGVPSWKFLIGMHLFSPTTPQSNRPASPQMPVKRVCATKKRKD